MNLLVDKSGHFPGVSVGIIGSHVVPFTREFSFHLAFHPVEGNEGQHTLKIVELVFSLANLRISSGKTMAKSNLRRKELTLFDLHIAITIHL